VRRYLLIPIILIAQGLPAAAQADIPYRTADAAMNVQYRATVAAVKRRAARAGRGDGGQAALLAAQRAWLRYRDAECAPANNPFQGGSAEPMAADQCLSALTRQRTERLRFAQEDADR